MYVMCWTFRGLQTQIPKRQLNRGDMANQLGLYLEKGWVQLMYTSELLFSCRPQDVKVVELHSRDALPSCQPRLRISAAGGHSSADDPLRKSVGCLRSSGLSEEDLFQGTSYFINANTDLERMFGRGRQNHKKGPACSRCPV